LILNLSMTMNADSYKSRENLITPCDGEVMHLGDSFSQKSSEKHPRPGPVDTKARQKPNDLPDNLARFMAYAG